MPISCRPYSTTSIINGMPCLKVTGIRGAYLLTDAGEKLADAYEKAIAKHPRRDWLADIGKQHVSGEDVAEMGGLLDLLNPSQGEIDAFIKQYSRRSAGQDSPWDRTGNTASKA